MSLSTIISYIFQAFIISRPSRLTEASPFLHAHMEIPGIFHETLWLVSGYAVLVGTYY